MTDKNSGNDSGDSRLEPKRPGIFSVLQSVLAAMFGVQSESKRKEDFEKGHPAEYIFVGIVMVIIFILTIVWVVNSAVSDYQAGG